MDALTVGDGGEVFSGDHGVGARRAERSQPRPTGASRIGPHTNPQSRPLPGSLSARFPSRTLSVLRALPLALLLVFAMAGGAAEAQPVRFEGTVVDADTGEPLPGATVQIDGTTLGDAADADGRVMLGLPTLPATLVVRFVGYAPTSLRLTNADAAQGVIWRDVPLSPSPFSLGEVEVSAEPPGERIWRRVLTRRQELARRIGSYSAEGYTRLVLLRDGTFDVAPIPIRFAEAISNTTWSRIGGAAEEVVARRRRPDGGPFRWADAGPIPDLYFEDVLLLDDQQVVSPTHPRSLDAYEFRLGETVERDGMRFLDLAVIPRQGGLVSGRIQVVDTLWTIAEADLRLDPRPRGATVDSYDAEYHWRYGPVYAGMALRDSLWLPTLFLREGRVDAGVPGFDVPAVRFRQRSFLRSHRVGLPGNVQTLGRRFRSPRGVYAGRDVYADLRAALPLDSVEVAADTLALLGRDRLRDFLPPEGIRLVFGPAFLSRSLGISVEGSDDP